MATSPIRNLSEAQRDFKSSLEEMGKSGTHLRDALDDFLFMASTAFRQAVHVFKTGSPDMEMEESLQVLKSRYKCPNDFGKALACMVKGFEIEAHDFLGNFYGAIDAHNEKTGQFFTPCSLSETIARMTLTREHYEATIAEGKRFSISEPAVGAGGMIIQVAKLMKEWDAHASTWYVDCTDVDIRCVRMAYVQFTLLGIPAFVRHGNTLSLEEWDCWPTLTMAMNPLNARPTVKEEVKAQLAINEASTPFSRKLVLTRKR